MKRKGFTLIELLAVIVILAIIALIAIPVITNVIENAKKGAAESSALGYLSAVENQVAINAVDTSKEDIADGEYEVPALEAKGVSVKGNAPTSGNVTITKGQVTACELTIDGYTVTCLGNGKVEIENFVGNTIGVLARTLLNNNEYGTYTYMGGTYLKGLQENNYVSYSGFLWRIMGVNENGTVRLITEENVTSLPYGADGEELLYATNKGYINDWLNNDFLNNLDNSKTTIEESNWCISAIDVSNSARTICDSENTFEAHVGIITLDEYNLVGESKTNYLVNGQKFWTLTPCNYYIVSAVWNLVGSGAVNYNEEYNVNGIRPIINISADSVVEGENGSLQSPYTIE